MSSALAMYRARPGALIVIALVSTLPTTMLAVGGDLAYGVPDDGRAALLRTAIVAVPTQLLSQISVAAAAVLAMELLNGRPATASHALEVVAMRFWPLAAVIGVTLVVVAAGIVLLVIPAIIIIVLWLYAPIISVAEGRPLRAAFQRSVALAKGALWWTLGSYLAIQITVTLAASLATVILSAPFTPLTGDPEIVAQGMVSLLVLTIAQPVALLGVGLMYLDRRVRREGVWPTPGGQPAA
jgi:hypothetical protein